MRQRIVVGALLVVFAASSALAKGIGKGDGELGFDFGGTNFDSNATDQTGALIAFRGGYHFTKVFELEGQVAVSGADESGVDILLTRTMVNAVFNFHPARKTIVPYFLVGIGSATLTFSTPFGDIDDSDVAYQGALGSRFYFGRKGSVAFRAELSILEEGTFDVSSTHTNFVGGFTWTL